MIRRLLRRLFYREMEHFEDACILRLGIDNLGTLVDAVSAEAAIDILKAAFSVIQDHASTCGGNAASLEPGEILVILPDGSNPDTRYSGCILADSCVNDFAQLSRQRVGGSSVLRVGIEVGRILYAPANAPNIGFGEAINSASRLLNIAREKNLAILASKDVIKGIEGRLRYVEHGGRHQDGQVSTYFEVFQKPNSSQRLDSPGTQ